MLCTCAGLGSLLMLHDSVGLGSLLMLCNRKRIWVLSLCNSVGLGSLLMLHDSVGLGSLLICYVTEKDLGSLLM